MNKKLPWHFEAFRKFLPYEVMQPAAAVLLNYEGEALDPGNPKIKELNNSLKQRTGLDWTPQRVSQSEIDINTEGDIFRNKGRLLSSLFIVMPKTSSNGKLEMLPFGRALGEGRVTKDEYYRFITTHYKYPHPAFEDNWESWIKSKKEFHPLIFIVQVLLNLHKKGRNACLTSKEIALFLHPISDNNEFEAATNSVIKNRENDTETIHKRTDEIDRKISDMLGFLAIAGYVYYDGSKVCLNLIGIHPLEKTLYFARRSIKEGEGDMEEYYSKLIDGKI